LKKFEGVTLYTLS